MMGTRREIEVISPKPYEVVGIKFAVSGKVPKHWLQGSRYGLSIDWFDIDGGNLPAGGPLSEVVPGILHQLKRRLRFLSPVDLSYFQSSEHCRGLILEISGRNNHYYLLPLIVAGTGGLSESEYGELKIRLSEGVKKIVQRKSDYENYKKELAEVRTSTVSDKNILEGVFDILEYSKETFNPFSQSYEEKREIEIAEKYSDVIAWRGPLLGGVVGRMNGYEFRVYSGDHNPRHFHVVHRSRGIDARFSYPEISLISYKGSSNTIGKNEVEKIQKFFQLTDNLQRLERDFKKQILL